MRIGQWAVMIYGWGVGIKSAITRVYWHVKLCDPCKIRVIFERFSIGVLL